MHLIRRSEIFIPLNRFRNAFPASSQQYLTNSILYVGLLHPIVVSMRKSNLLAPNSTLDYQLIAGERRLISIAAIAALNQVFYCDGLPVAPGEVPVTIVTNLDEMKLLQAELAENSYCLPLRVDEWKAAYEVLKELHERNLA